LGDLGCMATPEAIRSLYEREIPKLVQAVKTDPVMSKCLHYYACPFVPYVGKKYDVARIKILVVGKATCGWGDGYANLADFSRGDGVPDSFWEWSSDFINKRVVPFYNGRQEEGSYHSEFWRQTYRLTTAVLEGLAELPKYERCPGAADHSFSQIAWTNVFKIGGVCGNPDSRMERFFCSEPWCSLLLQELQILQPELVLFSTHNGYDRFLKQMLPEIELSEPDSDIADVGMPGLGFRGFRTVHFQNRRFSPECLFRRIQTPEANS
jgi:hypothetical protein